MLSSTLRSAARRVGSARRHVSTKVIPKAPKPSSTDIPSHTTLPPAKMRALISLYHQAENFITPENLSAQIDEVFVYRPQRSAMSAERETLLKDLRSELLERRTLPKMGEGKSVYSSVRQQQQQSERESWSRAKSTRETRVMHALYGTEDAGKPGLEILEEEEERIQAHIRRDREQRQQQPR
ncbi:uncharacterized protein PHACADRAFT_250355 [Phanerochaete carnosa HHB-10118-sp]|uniref:Uncharacterized protein n=1 Tax=Phanerochaete carnosa (strain HHB-10118-sp) TaxID=650164 RepID=K5WKK6_PHACS|nr:uncharacterized protein PHACADRAFT_250355 [Phanerochaete carnosa HHB-10118-sp]EKM59694.1 hypothetical protein PHACADRAFT_250355 [Phanerochaete carnosa HHB-10118-sp]